MREGRCDMYSFFCVQYNGINVRTCYKDFDRHHRGYITETQVSGRKIHVLSHLNLFLLMWFILYTSPFLSCLPSPLPPSLPPSLPPHNENLKKLQFHRSFPGPVDVTPEEIQALAQRYSDDPSLSAGGGAGLVNYLRFHGDVLAAMERGEREGEGTYHTPPGLPVSGKINKINNVWLNGAHKDMQLDYISLFACIYRSFELRSVNA